MVTWGAWGFDGFHFPRSFFRRHLSSSLFRGLPLTVALAVNSNHPSRPTSFLASGRWSPLIASRYQRPQYRCVRTLGGGVGLGRRPDYSSSSGAAATTFPVVRHLLGNRRPPSIVTSPRANQRGPPWVARRYGATLYASKWYAERGI